MIRATLLALIVSSTFAPLSLVGQTVFPDTSHWAGDAKDLRLHMIGNSHIDAVWLWPMSEADALVHSTFRSALDRMKEDPDITMTTSSSQFYEWVAGSDPAMIAEIRQRVAEGRWNLVNGWWVEPDVNMPSGESLIRQGLYGQRTLQKYFGRMATVGYNPDSFGHAGNLPQILKLEGMRDYVFMRPNASEKPDVKQNLFQWQGVDGTRTLTFRIPALYADSGSVRRNMETVVRDLAGQPERTAMDFFGNGDHGGGPTKINMASIRQIQGEARAPTIFYSTPERFFGEVSAHLPENVQVVTGDLQHHSVGCYTAGSEIKKMNRGTEAALETAEKFSAIGSVAWGAAYPKIELTKAWERLLLMQFHDSLAGTTLPSHFTAARDAFGLARDTATQAIYAAVERLAWQVPTTDPDSKYLVVFNPHAWPVKARVEYNLQWDRSTPTQVQDETGKIIPSQWTAPTTAVTDYLGLVAQVDVSAMGYRQIRVLRAETPAGNPAVHASAAGLENEHLKMTVADDGTIGLFDKDIGQQVFRGGETGGRAIVMDDSSDTWSHGVHAYDREIGSFAKKELKVVEDGPVRACLREKLTYGVSTLTVDWMLYAGSRKLEATVTLDWHEHQKMLKFSFPVDVEAPKATYEIGYGAIERATNGDEDPGQRWIDVTGTRAGRAYGLTVLNDAKYGYSVQANDMRVSVARAAVYAHHEPKVLDSQMDYNWMDQGVQTFRMELIPHVGTWAQAGVVRAAEELVTEVPIVYQGIHPGTRAQADSFLSVDAPNLVVEAIKQAEDNGDIILRSYETAGAATKASINLKFAGTSWSGEYHPFEIKTIRVAMGTKKVTEVDALER
jgi:alpha-mannosidase